MIILNGVIELSVYAVIYILNTFLELNVYDSVYILDFFITVDVWIVARTPRARLMGTAA